MDAHLEDLCEKACLLIKKTGNYIKSKSKLIHTLQIEHKGVRDFVSEVDKESERLLILGLQEILPTAGIIAEEDSSYIKSELYNWIIDPLDGTTNFLHQIPAYAISVALMFQDEIILGIVYEIKNDELFYTWKDAAAYMNENKIHISACTLPEHSIIATGFPYNRKYRLDGISQSLRFFLEHGGDVRRLGSASVDLCFVACGRFDIFYEGYLHIWDLAAGVIIAQNAGATVTDLQGNQNYFTGGVIAAVPDLYMFAKQGVKLNA